MRLKEKAGPTAAYRWIGRQPDRTDPVLSRGKDGHLAHARLAAMVEHPNRRCVLLVDDPPNPRRQDDMDTLAASRTVAGRLTILLRSPPNCRPASPGAPSRTNARSETPNSTTAAAFVSDLADKVEKGMCTPARPTIRATGSC